MAELESLRSFCTLFLAVVLCIAFTYHFILRLPPGLPRTSFLLPLLPIFFLLPWSVPSLPFRCFLSFMFLWTIPSKLLLLCCNSPFDFYPLSPSSSGFLYFLTSVLLPIRIRGPLRSQQPAHTSGAPSLLYFISVVCIMNFYPYKDRFPVWLIPFLFYIHIYVSLELALRALAKISVVSFGVEVCPHSNNPFMSASLSEFWSRRWNLVATSILRFTVYLPTQLLLTRVQNRINNHSSDRDELNKETRKLTPDAIIRSSSRSRAIAMFITFLVSGCYHELIFLFVSKSSPTGHAMAFFLLHGLATALEAYLRRAFPLRVRLPRAISIFFTLSFIYFTAVWIFLPGLRKTDIDVHAITEYHQLQSKVLSLFKTSM